MHFSLWFTEPGESEAWQTRAAIAVVPPVVAVVKISDAITVQDPFRRIWYSVNFLSFSWFFSFSVAYQCCVKALLYKRLLSIICRKPAVGLFHPLSEIAFPWWILHSLLACLILLSKLVRFGHLIGKKKLLTIRSYLSSDERLIYLSFMGVWIFGHHLWDSNFVQIGSAVGGTASAFYGFNHGMQHYYTQICVHLVELLLVNCNGWFMILISEFLPVIWKLVLLECRFYKISNY